MILRNDPRTESGLVPPCTKKVVDTMTNKN